VCQVNDTRILHAEIVLLPTEIYSGARAAIGCSPRIIKLNSIIKCVVNVCPRRVPNSEFRVSRNLAVMSAKRGNARDNSALDDTDLPRRLIRLSSQLSQSSQNNREDLQQQADSTQACGMIKKRAKENPAESYSPFIRYSQDPLTEYINGNMHRNHPLPPSV